MSIPVSELDVCNLAFEGNFGELKDRIAGFAEQLNVRDKYGKVALHYAMEGVLLRGISIDVCEKIMRLLLEHGANPNSMDGNRQTPLVYAAWNGMQVIVHLLMEKGADVTITDKNHGSALIYAVRCYLADPEPELQIVKLILSHPPLTRQDVMLKDNDGQTALSYATKLGKTEIGQLLFDFYDDIEIGLLLLDFYAIEIVGGTRGWLTREGHGDVQEFLFPEHEVDANDKRFFWAAWKGYADVIKHLLQRGADVNASDECGRTALHWALLRRQAGYHVLTVW